MNNLSNKVRLLAQYLVVHLVPASSSILDTKRSLVNLADTLSMGPWLPMTYTPLAHLNTCTHMCQLLRGQGTPLSTTDDVHAAGASERLHHAARSKSPNTLSNQAQDVRKLL